MNIQTNPSTAARRTNTTSAPRPESTFADKAAKHFAEEPMDAVFLGMETVYTAASALNAAGDFNPLFDGLTGLVGVSNFAIAGFQAYRGRKLEGSEAKTAKLASAGSFLKGLGMIGAATGMGPAGLALYGVGAATSLYADVK